jgi:dTDP-4-amino-4,6-dideoxygalactose transaminase
VGRGHAVVTVSHTAVATVAAIVMTGAQPVFADIDPRTMTMSPESLEETVIRHRRAGRAGGAELKAVVVVHLYGHPARMDAILRVAERHGLEVVEDCAQSHGAAWMGRQTGTWGRAAAFSFYPTKNLGALGDGGAVVTRDGELAERVRLLREYGWRERYVSEVSGRNSRLDELQAAVLRVRLRYLERENGMRCRLAQAYDQALQGAGVRLPQSLGEARHVFHQYVIRTAHRDALRDALQRCGVGTLIHYPVPIHLQPAYRGVARGEALPETEAAAGEVLSLPMFPQLRLEEVDFVAEQIRAIVAAWTSG